PEEYSAAAASATAAAREGGCGSVRHQAAIRAGEGRVHTPALRDCVGGAAQVLAGPRVPMLYRGVERTERGKPDGDIDRARERAHLAEDRRNEVEAEEADEAPVEAADDQEHHRDPVDGVHLALQGHYGFLLWEW